MGASRSQQVGLVFVLAVALYVPHSLHNRLLARIEADTEAAVAMMEELYKQSQQQQQDLQKVSAQKADVEKELEEVREAKKNDQEKFQEVQAGDCGALKLEQEFRARLDSEHKKLNTESEPRLHQLDLEANSLRHSSQEEMAEMDSTLPRLQAQEEELRKSTTERMAEVQLGANLRDNDSGFVRQWVQRVLTMDLFMGPFLMNQINAPLMDHPIVMPKWKAESDTVGKATQDFKDNLPKMDPFLKPRPVLYRSCAVVGTSGNLLYYRSGASIDSHDAVFRFNAATTTGFEEFVGSKTTVRFTDRANFGFHERESEIVLQLVTNPHTFEKYVAHRKENPSSRVFMVAPEFHLHVASDLVGPASPAFYGVLFALQRCQEVELFGFARSGNDEAPYHYYNAEQPEEAELKRERQEEALVKELLRRTDGRMRVMEPCAMEEDCEGELNCRYCAYGSRCICGKSMPVAKMGFCMESGVADCFYACKEPNECPGGESYTICADQAKGSECAKSWT